MTFLQTIRTVGRLVGSTDGIFSESMSSVVSLGDCSSVCIAFLGAIVCKMFVKYWLRSIDCSEHPAHVQSQRSSKIHCSRTVLSVHVREVVQSEFNMATNAQNRATLFECDTCHRLFRDMEEFANHACDDPGKYKLIT